jgi:hypothetical protein
VRNKEVCESVSMAWAFFVTARTIDKIFLSLLKSIPFFNQTTEQKLTFHLVNVNCVPMIMCSFKTDWYWWNILGVCRYHISTTKVTNCCKLCHKICCLKHNKNIPKFSRPQAKNTKRSSKKTVLFFCSHKSFYRYRVNVLYWTACAYLLFNLTQFIRCVLERSIKNDFLRRGIPLFYILIHKTIVNRV